MVILYIYTFSPHHHPSFRIISLDRNSELELLDQRRWVTGKFGLGIQNEEGQRTTSNDFKYNSLLFIPNGISKGREMGGMPRN